MDFDQMLETWRTQDAAPLYGVNRDALRQALQTEDASVRRKRRRDMWIVCIGGAGTAVLGGFWVAISIRNSWPAIYTVAAGLGFGIVALWVGAYCVSRWRQAKSERNFGNTLQGEVRRTLSRIDVEISRFSNWRAATLQIAPVMAANCASHGGRDADQLVRGQESGRRARSSPRRTIDVLADSSVFHGLFGAHGAAQREAETRAPPTPFA